MIFEIFKLIINLLAKLETFLWAKSDGWVFSQALSETTLISRWSRKKTENNGARKQFQGKASNIFVSEKWRSDSQVLSETPLIISMESQENWE